jgi:Beta-L-arabinofuranosidase, GH127 catalytic domain/PcRGLX-like N-terminal RIFT barrel domain
MSNTPLPNNITVREIAAPGGPGWVRFGLPLEEGRLEAADSLALTDGAGGVFGLQTRPLVTWPDGSVRWLDCQASLGQGGDFDIVEEDAPLPPGAVSVTESDEGLLLENGLVALELSTIAPSPVSRILFNGVEVSCPEMPLEATVTAARTGQIFTSAESDSREIRLIESGPVRAVAEVIGTYGVRAKGEIMTWRLRVEVMAGLPHVILRYRFSHTDPGIDFHALKEINLRTHWLGGESRHLHQRAYGMTWVPRDVATDSPVDIRAEAGSPRIAVHNADCLADNTDYPEFMPPTDSVLPLAGVRLPNGWVTAHVADFAEQSPTGLTADGDALCVQAWPEWAGELMLPQGRSRETTVRLLFTSGEAPPKGTGLLQRIAAGEDGGKVMLPQEWMAAHGGFSADRLFPICGDRPSRFDRKLRDLASLPTVHGMWDLGDTIDPGYSSTYAPLGRLERRPVAQPYFECGGHNRLAAWSSTLLYEPVWANNEYDAILALCQEALRGGGSPELLRRTRWFARHAIEVDFCAFSDHPELHHGTPAHSAEHRKATAYPSHLWCEGLLAYYALTGDDDALDVAIKQGDFILNTFADEARRNKLWSFSRELGWALLYLATLADFTNEARFRDAANELANALISEPITEAQAEQMVECSFGYASIALGVEALWKLEGRQELADWLVSTSNLMGECVARGVRSRVPPMTLCYFNAAYAVSGDAAHIRAGMVILEEIFESPLWIQPSLFAKPVAMLYRGVARFLRAADEAGWLQELDYRFGVPAERSSVDCDE